MEFTLRCYNESNFRTDLRFLERSKTMEGYLVKVEYDSEYTASFGPFEDRGEAAQCVIVLAVRSDVVSATIEEQKGGDA